MNIISIVSDTFRRDYIGAYGDTWIHTSAIDAFATGAVRSDAHFAAGFPTMPTRADHQTGRWTMSFMGWQPLPSGVTTLAEILAKQGLHTVASVDTPCYLRDGMNYDRGFQFFSSTAGRTPCGLRSLSRTTITRRWMSGLRGGARQTGMRQGHS